METVTEQDYQQLKTRWHEQQKLHKKLSMQWTAKQKQMWKLKMEVECLVDLVLEANPDIAAQLEEEDEWPSIPTRNNRKEFLLEDDLEDDDVYAGFREKPKSKIPSAARLSAPIPISLPLMSATAAAGVSADASIAGLPSLFSMNGGGAAAASDSMDPLATATATDTVDAAGPASASGKKRKRTSTAAPVRKKLTEIPRDEEGNAVLPVTLSTGKAELIVLDFGHVVFDRDGYHTNRYIYPVGFKSQRSFTSFANADTKTVYTCEIVDGGDIPMFQVTATDDPEERAFRASSASGAWKMVLDELSAKNAGSSNTHASGPDLFGLSNPAVLKFIQVFGRGCGVLGSNPLEYVKDLPGAELCRKYQRYPRVQAPASAAAPGTPETAAAPLTSGAEDMPGDGMSMPMPMASLGSPPPALPPSHQGSADDMLVD